ncbi:DNA/RNA nuclease SfsA [Persephonella atlantica]|uniref:Sugar fermentation stimulation protein homolog n=1 Tax=Persephonella atlantica TaxID=2699429 RepID=A0ABS1GFQ6_9AQUI|nr:DNA/RNA nuclease SfsA [Persephonella atlantica]MBK3331763.1 DNA/RNA nuclease SfsA [Persephonella atlantica]
MKLFSLNSLGKLEEATFVERPNRFTAICRKDGKNIRCHVADSGRLKEILTEGRKLLVVKNPPDLKTDYKILAAKMEEGWILLNTSLHSKIGKEAIKNGVLGFIPKEIKTEVKWGNSRIDYLIDSNTFVELKGSNLLVGNRCIFPDAPTERGTKHLRELIDAVKDGYSAIIMIMALRDCECFQTNKKLDPQFSEIFEMALNSGVRFLAFKIEINRDYDIVLKDKIPLCR